MPQGAVFAGTVLGSSGDIYVLGGSTQYDGNLRTAVQVYHPGTDSWSEGSPIPTPRTSPGVAIGADGKIYVAGGAAGRVRQLDVLEAYDPKTDTWSRCKPLPTPRDAPQAVAAQGADGHLRIYVLGGRNRTKPGTSLSIVEAYDPENDTWATMAPMPIPLHAHGATRGADGRIYVVGGTNNTVTCTNALQIYDPRQNTWTMGPPMPYGQECAAVTAISSVPGEILVFGGWDNHKRPLRRAVAYNPQTHHWRALPSAPAPRAASGAVVLDTGDGCLHVYVVGGTGEAGSGQQHPHTPVESTVEEYSFRPATRSR
ncbi:MAG: hypothetical protein JOZ57_07510 [Abitibacteriaceae bacterium]|nr:hypothetical protein [Abditibacteriaceae bacterium]